MKLRILMLCAVCIGLTCTAAADTLVLTNGQVITGIFMGRSSAGVQFVGPDGTSQIYPSEQVQSLSFGPVPTPPQAPPAAPQQTQVPAGTVLLVRMVDGLDTSSAYTGQLFSATLSTNLAANGYVVANAGTTVYGQVVQANSAGRATGTSQLKLQLTQIVINGNAIPIMTDVFDSQKGKSSSKTIGIQAPGWRRPGRSHRRDCGQRRHGRGDWRGRRWCGLRRTERQPSPDSQ